MVPLKETFACSSFLLVPREDYTPIFIIQKALTQSRNQQLKLIGTEHDS